MPEKPEQVGVEIFGQTYAVRAPAADARYVEELAAFVDARMREVSRSAGPVDTMRVAVLAALNVADECFRLRNAARDTEAAAQARAAAAVEAAESRAAAAEKAVQAAQSRAAEVEAAARAAESRVAEAQKAVRAAEARAVEAEKAARAAEAQAGGRGAEADKALQERAAVLARALAGVLQDE